MGNPQLLHDEIIGLEQMFLGWETKVRSERRMGEILKEMPKQEGYRTPTALQNETPLLEDLGITAIQSHRYQQISNILEDKFNKMIEELRLQFKEGEKLQPTIFSLS